MAAIALATADLSRQSCLPSPPAVRLIAIEPQPNEFDAWQAYQAREYSREKVASGAWSAESALARAETENAALLPNGFAITGHHIRRIEDKATQELIGWIWVSLAAEGPPGLAGLYDIEIIPEHRGQGQSREVMQLAEMEAKLLGCTRLGLHVFATNKVAHHLYETCGYQVTDLSMVKVIG